jgi:branched-chain amino acid transport system permease protein
VAELVRHVVDGLAAGAIYALLALAIVLVQRASGVLNFAQGAMATLSAFLCWTLLDHGWAFWPAFAATLALSFGGGLVVEIVLVRPLRNGPPLALLLLTVGLLLAIDGLVTWVWGGSARRLADPFPTSDVHVGGVSVPQRELAVIGVAAASILVLWLLVSRTKVGLGLRAAAAGASEARFSGVPVPALVAVGWALAATLGATAGVLAATSSSLTPGLLGTAILYAFAAALLGGVGSLPGAIAGGLLLGVGVNLLGSYVDWVGDELRLATAFAVVLVALLVRPAKART